MSESSNFEKFKPKITEVDVVRAAAIWGEGGEIQSLAGKRTAIDGFILVLADDQKEIGPFIMQGACARALCATLIEEGFGPKDK